MAEDRLNHHELPSAPVEQGGVDPAGESLANALRVSFKLLSVLMLVWLRRAWPIPGRSPSARSRSSTPRSSA